MRTFKGKNYVAHLDLGKVLAGKAAAGRKGVEMAAVFLVGELKQALSRPGPDPGTLKGKKRERQKQRIREAGETQRVSKPGEPPRRRTGTLRASITYEMMGLVARVGSALKYLYWLEWGTATMGARPVLRPVLAANAARIKDIIVGFMRKG